jgi:hypothetical protein
VTDGSGFTTWSMAGSADRLGERTGGVGLFFTPASLDSQLSGGKT